MIGNKHGRQIHSFDMIFNLSYLQSIFRFTSRKTKMLPHLYIEWKKIWVENIVLILKVTTYFEVWKGNKNSMKINMATSSFTFHRERKQRGGRWELMLIGRPSKPIGIRDATLCTNRIKSYFVPRMQYWYARWSICRLSVYLNSVTFQTILSNTFYLIIHYLKWLNLNLKFIRWTIQSHSIKPPPYNLFK